MPADNCGHDDQDSFGVDRILNIICQCPSTGSQVSTHIRLERNGMITLLIAGSIEQSHWPMLGIGPYFLECFGMVFEFLRISRLKFLPSGRVMLEPRA